MRIDVDGRWRVHAEVCMDLPLGASAAWGQVRDFRRFLTIDPLHRRVRLDHGAAARLRPVPGAPVPVGTRLVIEHRFLGFGPDRHGRLLWWSERRGFAVSDLSRRGRRSGFPHACIYEVQPLGETACRLRVAARGRWTATWMPRPLVRLWLAWVLATTAAHLRAEFRRFRAAVRRRRGTWVT